MTSEELKSAVKITDLFKEYGIQINNKSFCCCPFHNEKTASMKVYTNTNTFHCFGCGKSGDVFTFVQNMDNCDFKTAFIKLGGTYKAMSNNERIVANTKRERERKQREMKEAAAAELKAEVGYIMDLLHECGRSLEPFSDEWTYALNKIPLIEEYWEAITSGKEVDTINVYRMCRNIRRHFNIGTRIV
ncbi:MAG: CHC2 zinc finger domain-containing protein [Bacteroidales bacterium]|nr:CHC2 zinc finger domain-containing protein [Bacteroidales bacterium]